MGPAYDHQVGKYVRTEPASAVSIVAAGAGDNVEVPGRWISRRGSLSARALVAGVAALAEGETLTIGLKVRDAVDATGTDAADLEAGAATVVATGGAGGTTEYPKTFLNVDLSGAREFVALDFTPDLSRAGTDTAILAGVFVLGSMEVPTNG